MLRAMRKATESIVRSAAVIMALLFCAACGSTAAKSAGMYNEECTVNEDCEMGLTCANKVCTLACTGDALCQARDPKATCNAGSCSNRCLDIRDCPPGLKCVMHFNSQTCGIN
jgi:hypothetical protein